MALVLPSSLLMGLPMLLLCVLAHASELVPETRMPAFYHTSADVRQLLSELAGAGPGQACPGLSLTRTKVKPDHGDVLIGEAAVAYAPSPEENVLDAVRISRGGGPKRNRLALLFNEHGRELITAELGIHLLKALCGRGHNSSAAFVEGAQSGAAVSMALQRRAEAALADTEFLIMPNIDENGRQRAEGGDTCKSRDNENHVDLNRNWGYKWVYADDDANQEGGSGSHEFSEPETIVTRKYLEEFKPTSFLSVHSGARGIYLPGAYSQDESKAKQQLADSWDTMTNIARSVNEQTKCDCTMGSAGRVAHKDHPGTSLDYAALQMGIPYSMVFEVWLKSCEDCVPRFSPDDEAAYRRVVDTWTNSILFYAEATAKAQSSNKALRVVRKM